MVPALIQIGHLLGVAMAVGGLIFLHYAVIPAGSETLNDERTAFVLALRRRARVITLAAIALIVVTGLLKWVPETWGTGGVGWLGGRGPYTAVLHSKILLGILALTIAFVGSRPTADGEEAMRRTRKTKAALHMALLVIVLAVLHRTRAFGS